MGGWWSESRALKEGKPRFHHLYHGSHQRIANRIEPRASRVLQNEAAVFATPLRAMALTFIPKWRDQDISLGVIDGDLVFAEEREHAFRELIKNQAGYLYTVSPTGFESDPRLGMPRHEFIRREPVRILETEYIADVWKALKHEKIVLIKYSDTERRAKYGL